MSEKKQDIIYANLSVISNKLDIDVDADVDLLAAEMKSQSDDLTTSLNGILNGVRDVLVNGSSVVVNDTAYVTVPTKVSQLENDSKFVIEDEAGRYLIKTEDLEAGTITVSLYSKSEKKLSHVTFTRTDYLPGVAIGIGENRKINLLYDLNAFYVDEENRLKIKEDYLATKEYVDEKVGAVEQQLSILIPEVQELSIIVSAHTTQLSILENTVSEHTSQLSILNTKVDEHSSKLSILETTKLDKDLSILPNAEPASLSIESQENLLVYLYNTKDNTASKAKLTELGYWDVNN